MTVSVEEFNREAFQQEMDVYHLWADAESDATRTCYRHQLGVRFGDDPRQVLNVYFPNRPVGVPTPIFVFVHGGGFRTGEPNRTAYIGEALLEAGVLFVTPSYRILPQTAFPDSADDVDQALQYIVQHAAEWGGTADRVYLGGHSAGATLAAEVGLRPRGIATDLIKGLMVVGGGYLATGRAGGLNVNTQSPRYVSDLLDAIEILPPHCIVAAGSNEQMPATIPSCRALADGIQARGGSVEFLLLDGAEHFHSVDHLASPDGPLYEAVERMMQLSRFERQEEAR
jgi:acetyl esterase/lipase